MTFDLPLAVGGLLVGMVVGLTGMGGGALMTPMLVSFFGVGTLTAISSDLVASLVMKPFGAFVHFRRGTVNPQLVGWLCLGSVPSALAAGWLIGFAPAGDDLDAVLKVLLGLALLVATAGLVLRAFVQMWRNNLPLGEGPAGVAVRPHLVIRPLPTVALGAFAGFMVGLTSVGAGSIVIVALLLMYPALKASSLVGTDLAQAIPLVAAAAVGHLLFGDVSLDVTWSLLVGAIPGTLVGAQFSTRAPGGIIRRILAVLLLASGLKLLGVPSDVVVAASFGTLAVGSLAWVAIRRYRGRLVRPDRGSARRARGARGAAPGGDPVP